jgi:hypothetical protein
LQQTTAATWRKKSIYTKALLDHARHNSGLTFDICLPCILILRGVGKRRNRVAKCREREKKSIIVIGIMCKCKVLNYRTPPGISFDGEAYKAGITDSRHNK